MWYWFVCGRVPPRVLCCYSEALMKSRFWWLIGVPVFRDINISSSFCRHTNASCSYEASYIAFAYDAFSL